MPSSFFCARSSTRTSSLAPAFRRLRTGGSVSSRDGEQHRDRLHLGDDADAGGVAHRDVVALVDHAQADAAGERRDDPRVGDVELGGVDLRLVDDQRGLVLAHQRLLGVELLAGDRILRDQLLVALEVDLGVLEQRLVLAPACRSPAAARPRRAADRPRASRSPCLTIWPSLKSTWTSWPVIWVFTLTVCSGVTVPSARMTIGMSPLAAVAMPTGCGMPPRQTGRPLAAVGTVPVCEIYQPAPATMASPKPIPSRVLSLFILSLCPQRAPTAYQYGPIRQNLPRGSDGRKVAANDGHSMKRADGRKGRMATNGRRLRESSMRQ